MLQDSVLSSVREGLKDHLVGVKVSKIVMAKDILCTFSSSSQVGSGRGLAKLLGVDRRNISKARSRRQILDAGHDAFWLHQRRSVRSNSLPESVRLTVQQWWANETTVSLNRKDIITFHEGLRQWISHPTHFLQCSQVQQHNHFHLDLIGKGLMRLLVYFHYKYGTKDSLKLVFLCFRMLSFCLHYCACVDRALFMLRVFIVVLLGGMLVLIFLLLC